MLEEQSRASEEARESRRKQLDDVFALNYIRQTHIEQ
jgi:hypothetical protein